METPNILTAINSQINASAVATIENQLFNVVKVPLVTEKTISVDGIWQKSKFESPKDIFGTYREQGGSALGIVGKDFNPTQPKAVFEVLVQSLLELKINTDKMEYHEHADGSKIRFKVPLRSIDIKQNKAKLNDVTDVFLNFQTGFDGKTSTSLFLETKRLVCLNGMRVSATEHETKFRNTKGNDGKAVSIIGDIIKQVQMIEHLNEIYKRLNAFEVDEATRTKYIELVTGYDLKKYSELSTRTRNIIDQLQSDIEKEINDSGATLFGLFNGITRYNNHSATNSKAKDFLMYGAGAKMNDKALLQAFAILNDKTESTERVQKKLLQNALVMN